MATTSVGTDRKPYQALEKYDDAVFLTDDKKFYFGNNGDGYGEYDEDGNDVVLWGGADWRFSDTQKVGFGDAGDATIAWDGARLALGGIWDLAGKDVEFSDTQQLRFGNDSDFRMCWDGTVLSLAGGPMQFADAQRLCWGASSDIKAYFNSNTGSETLMLTGLMASDPVIAGGVYTSDATVKISGA